MPDEDDDDDLILDLPPLGTGDDESTPEDDDLGLEDLVATDTEEDDEEVGLDDSTGLEDEQSLFALELPPEEAEAAEGEKGLEELPFDEGIDADGEEEGWTEESGAASDEPWDPHEADLPELAPLGTEDGGEEGLDEVVDLGIDGDAVPHLPALDLDAGEDEEAEELSIGEDALIEEAALSFEEERRQMGREVPPALDAPGCTVAHLGPRAGAIYAVELSSHGSLAGGHALHRLGPSGLSPVDAPALADHDVVSIARLDDDVVIGTRLGGAFTGAFDGDALGPLRRSEGLEALDASPQEFHLRAEAGGARLWGRGAGGGLYRSEDRGRSWTGPLLLKPALALATPDEGGVVVLCAGRDAPAQLVGSEDGGERWAAVDAPDLAEGDSYLAVCGELVALASDADAGGPFLSADGGRSWARVPGLPPTGPMALVREPGGLSLYAAHFFEGSDRGVVVRYRPDGGEPGRVLDVAERAADLGDVDEGDREGDHRVYALRASSEGETTVLHVATGVGLFRVRIDPDELP
ncbi:MAG TPA: hypothetical protein RMH99_00740 [Sandaracinaceae bacterium LLY-WYZ-13_1]|nr:hypothetical protein [Sandaracinaceae bacterium LLY-WYZ-13_1]